MSSDLLIVGLGASAGGITAAKRFFEQVPPDIGAAFVVILHLSPEHESRLAEVLQASTTMPVTQVQERTRVEANHVYVIPPSRSMSMLDGHLALQEIHRIEERRAPVDLFFRTLGDTHRARAVGVVLSGTGADGSMGLKRIKENGGLCFAQDPAEAEYSDMPRNAIATGMVDQVLPAALIPAKILFFKQHLAAAVPAAAEPSTENEDALRDVFLQLRRGTGHDFSNYKQATVLRRVSRRMTVTEVGDLQAYAQVLRQRPEELDALLKDLLISVTNFFRDGEAFETLQRLVIPALFEGKGEDDQVRVWVAACATGEEAYSIAMLLDEYAASVRRAPAVQIFATDIDAGSILAARQGLYSSNEAADVSVERLGRHFTKEDDGYRVRKELRELILFSQHNVIRDPPFSHLDLVSCRNLLIYLNRTAQRRVMESLHFALRPAKFLFLGSSESVDAAPDLFGGFEKDAYLFQRRNVPTRAGLSMPAASAPPAALIAVAPRPDEARGPDRMPSAELHQRMLEEYAPPSVVINADHLIVHLSDSAGRFMRVAGGDPTHSLLKLVHPDLRLELQSALFQAAHQRAPVQTRDVSLRLDERDVRVKLLVRPVLRDGGAGQGFFLVLFQEIADGGAPAAEIPAAAGDVARQLEAEVTRLEMQLLATSGRYEQQVEEQKAANEELQAMNEELRSASEELETSREELQSLNEELRTVNQELRINVDEQVQANDDMRNLINSTDIATIFLDRSSRIKLFTPTVRSLFSLIPADRGRPLSDISSVLAHAELHRDVERVMETLERVERELPTTDGRWLLMRLHPYRTADDRIDGVVLTFFDITGRKRAEDLVQRTEARLRLIIESVTEYAILTMDVEGRVDSWNPGAAEMFGYTDEEMLGQPGGVLFTPEDRASGADREELRQASDGHRAAGERWHQRKDGSRLFASGILSPLRDQQGGVVGFVKVARDLTDRKRWEDALQATHSALELRVQERTAALEGLNRRLDEELQQRRQAELEVRSLLARVISVQEGERRRIARDLHDHLGQQVAGLSLKLESLEPSGDNAPEMRARVEEARTIIARLDRDLDFFTWELRPAALDDLGLVVALRHFVQEWSSTFGVPAEFHSNGLDEGRLGLDIETNLYRISQEALNNVHKHAGATRVGVILERRGSQAVLVIEDNGRGFDQANSAGREETLGIGLLGIRERASLVGGSAEIETEPGKGTTVFVQVPAAVVDPPAAAGPPD